MIRLLVLVLVLVAGPAAAHALKVFATEAGGQVTGYAFFIGGGRAQGAGWHASADGAEIASGKTDRQGAFAFDAPARGNVEVTVDTGDGHAGMATLALTPAATGVDTAVLEADIARLEARIEAMDNRLRFTDILSALFLIGGLAGMALWALGRRR